MNKIEFNNRYNTLNVITRIIKYLSNKFMEGKGNFDRIIILVSG